MAIVGVLAASACSSAGPTTTSPLASASPGRDAAAAAAVRYAVGAGNSFGGDDVATAVLTVDEYIVDGDRPGWRGTGERIGDTGRTSIEAALAPKPVTWVTASEALTHAQRWMANPGPGGAFVVAVGSPSIDDGRATAAVSTWCGGTCGTGGTLRLELAGDAWTVTDFSPRWIS